MAEHSAVHSITRKAAELKVHKDGVASKLEKKRQESFGAFGVSKETLKTAKLNLLPWVLEIKVGKKTETHLVARDRKENIKVIEKGPGPLKVSQNIELRLDVSSYSRLDSLPPGSTTTEPRMYSRSLILSLKGTDGKEVASGTEFSGKIETDDRKVVGHFEIQGWDDKKLGEDFSLSYKETARRVQEILVPR